jgi:hypothetical protein
MRFSNPADIARHYRFLDKIHAVVSKSSDTAKMRVRNDNLEKVEGVAFKLVMPKIENGCSYETKGATLARIVEDNFCEVYVSVNLDANSESNLTVEPTIEKNLFTVRFTDYPTEGDVEIVIKDSSNRSVSDAVLTLGGIAKKTDGNGTAIFQLRRGNYTITAEKPGFVSLTTEIEVKGRIYLLERIPKYYYIIVVFILAVIYYEIRKRFHSARKGGVG